MPKDRKDRSLSSRTSPYPCSSRRTLRSSSKSPSEPVEDVKEWEEARCPVCMEHPHNAVLLLCSSHGKGCRPYMCDTSYRHSNCLDQFRKASGEAPTTSPDEAPQATVDPPVALSSEESNVDLEDERSYEGTPLASTLPCEGHLQLKLSCPLCRGQVNGWIVVEPARLFMNAKARSCACESCDFNGNYADLRKHARLKHPLVRPSEADPQRQHDWTMLERERDLGDVLSTIQSAFGEDRADDAALVPGSGLLSVLIFFRVSRTPLTESVGSSSNSSSGSSIWSSPSRSRGQTRSRRRTSVASIWGGNYETETGSNTRDGENGPSEGVPPPGSWRLLERNRRWNTTSDEDES